MLIYESHALNFNPEKSVIRWAQAERGLFPDLNLSPEPGRPLSLSLGWSGLSIILLTNIYVLRKRFSLLKDWGRLSNWLDFHILCGLMGPTLILFHCNFKVRGLVAISFWSMMVSATSGVLGRYFYVQLLQREEDLRLQVAKWEKVLERLRTEAKKEIAPEELETAKTRARLFVGVPRGKNIDDNEGTNVLSVIFSIVAGDLRTIFGLPQTIPGMTVGSRYTFLEYATAVRRVKFFEPFQRLLGYWHSFHLPFAYFMYAAAVIHVAAALAFGVKK